ncbi:MAG: hypothetical protein ABH885_05900 [Candidatus Omnitrophota bacterium]
MEAILTFLMYVFGIMYIVIGALLVFATDMARAKIFNKLLEADIQKLSIIPLVVGIILILAAKYSSFVVLITILGLAAVVKGVMGYVATDKMAKLSQSAIKASNNTWKVFGVIVILIGSIVLVGI